MPATFLKGEKMLDGNEVEGKIGSGGQYKVDINDSGIVRIESSYAEGGIEGGAFVQADIIDLLRKLAAKSTNKLDDAAVNMIAGALGR